MTINILKTNGIKRAIAAVVAAAALVSVAACGNSSSASSDANGSASGKVTKITVGVCPGPYGDMVDKVIAPLLKDDGYELKTKLFNDYVQPDKALASGSIQANLMQHINYLKKFTKDNNLDLTSLGQVPTLGLGIYSNKYKSIKDIKDGSTVSIAADGSNLARSLGVLEQQGLVTLKDGIDATKASVNDIASNPKNLKIKTLDAAQLARSVSTVDVALVPGNFAWAAGLKPSEALATEKQDEGVINVFVVNTKDADSDFGKAVKKLLVSQEFKDAIAKSEFKDFGKPTTW
ncbi:metal ABC transporter substrate-binding protein [Bifidobacterium sp. 64T4]|uniref:MetQ/NlpA family ABC transporter substrate-binding protein n=1 Tax=Bifidobacterium pongonis TaxID=2834432 RepID=UPI001C585E41|nr:MetQ/NlpA family ABC transporter substrate-binding protein [Bifidobacterium pongonis]MBW3095188.1 metal ABC transporter substrate-binding protein [Bifidobacterium pongonis]